MVYSMLPRILVIDDIFGRVVKGSRNTDRENLCSNFLWRDVSSDSVARASQLKVLQPVAEVVFCRGQTPVESTVGDWVENNLPESLAIVRKGWMGAFANGRLPWAMVLLDLCFYTGRVTVESNQRTPGMPEGQPGDDDPHEYFGLKLLDAIHQEFPELPVFILSSKQRENVSLEFSRRGALGFIDRTDPQASERLDEALCYHGLFPDFTGKIVGTSLPLLLALREARRVAYHQENVLIRGERGSGKELIAHYIHSTATVNNEGRPFIAVNSAIFTPNLFSSELFGIKARTATGVDGKVGLIESANGGDLFLDEIADMPTEVQAAMLRVLQDRQITRVGGRKSIPVDVRFISASNINIEGEASGFRQDLLDRLRGGGTIWLPSLRERVSDIPLLVDFFLQEVETQRPATRHHEVTSEAMQILQTHKWPGNVRELRSIIYDALTQHPDVEYLVPEHLRLSTARGHMAVIDTVPTGLVNNSESDGIDDLVRRIAAISFESKYVHEWSGKFECVQREYWWLMARMLQAALEATRRRTPTNPNGNIQIHPAVKLLTGDTKLTASKAADLIKRLLAPIEGDLNGPLREAHQIALRLRPRSAPRSKQSSS